MLARNKNKIKQKNSKKSFNESFQLIQKREWMPDSLSIGWC